MFFAQNRFGCVCCSAGGGQPSPQPQLLLVATCHIHWDPDYSDVKLIQTMMLMNELKHIVDDVTSLAGDVGVTGGSVTGVSVSGGSIGGAAAGLSSDSDDCRTFTGDIPLILCGDFNSLPDSGFIYLYL